MCILILFISALVLIEGKFSLSLSLSETVPHVTYKYFSSLVLLLPVPRWACLPTDLPSDRNISKTVRVNIAFSVTFLNNIQQALNGLQVDKFCTCGSQVIDVKILCNYWHLKNGIFRFFW